MLALILDRFLVGLAGVTIALIVWKVVELYLPFLRRQVSLERTVTNDLELDVGLERLERGMSLLATIAATAPFVGLGATVLHIMQALSMLAGHNAEAGVIARPIATALNSTLLGLASAVPAAIAYNLMQRRLQVIENRARRHLKSTASAPVGIAASPPLSRPVQSANVSLATVVGAQTAPPVTPATPEVALSKTPADTPNIGTTRQAGRNSAATQVAPDQSGQSPSSNPEPKNWVGPVAQTLAPAPPLRRSPFGIFKWGRK